MSEEILLEIGRVVFINYGPCSGKIAVVVDIVNNNRVVVDGPGLGLAKRVISTKRLELTKFRIPNVDVQEGHKSLKKKIEEMNLSEKFNGSGRGLKIKKQKRRQSLTDFERFKVFTLKRKLGRTIRTFVNKNRKELLSKSG